jgi:hypothetical protein
MSPNKLVVDVSPFTPKQHDVGIRHSALAPWFKKQRFPRPWPWDAMGISGNSDVASVACGDHGDGASVGQPDTWLLSGSRI